MSSASAQPPGPGAISSGDLLLAVAAQSVQEYADEQAALTTIPQLNPLPIPLLRGPLADMCLYSRAERTRWLHDMAHDICDPVNRAGTLWVQNMSSGDWTLAAATDELLSAIYEYRAPSGTLLRLSRFSVRHSKSLTSSTGTGADMRHAVTARDGRCWISGAASGLATTNSHILPKRMGDAMASHIYNEFCGVTTTSLSVYNAEFGICLLKTIDPLFDIYEMGLRQIGHDPDVYEAHNFHRDVPIDKMTFLGFPFAGLPLLHGRQVDPPQPQTTDPVPPPGLFRWHYMQCVLRRFGADDYKGLPNIKHHELPFRTEDDEDGEQFEDDGSFDWPSAVFDRGSMQARVEAEQAEQLDRVVRWIAP